MSERARVISIFAAVGVIAGGAGYYFFGVYQPAQVKKAARAEITRWEQRWQAARGCLLGGSPGSSKTSEALAIHELSPDPWDRGSCTPLIGHLSRGSAPNTGLPKVEHAWDALDRAASHAASAYALHVSTHPSPDPLPAALDALDDARAALRAAAGMPAETSTGKPLPPAQLVPIALDGTPLFGLELSNVPSAHGLVAFGALGEDDNVEVVLRPGQPPQVERVLPGMLRSLPDGSWAALPTNDEIQAGAVDAKGQLASPMALELPQPVLAGLIGTLAHGDVIYGDSDKLVIGHAEAGKITGAPIAVDAALVQTDTDGRALVAWSAKQARFAQLLGPAGDAPPVALADPPNDASCLTADGAWILSNGARLVGIAGGKVSVRYPDGDAADNLGELSGCTPEAAVVRSPDDPKHVLVCDTSCRTVAVPSGAPETAAVALAGGKPVAIAADAQVVGVWRAGAAPVYYALPQAATLLPFRSIPQLALSDGKVIDAVARVDHGYAIIRLPAAPAQLAH